MLKQQIRKNMKLHRQMNELQQEQEQQGAQHALANENVLVQVIDPSQQLA